MGTPSDIGRRLRLARTEAKVSLASLAHDIGVPEAQLEELEKGGKAKLSTAALARAAKHLGLKDTALWAEGPSASVAMFFRHASVPDFFSEDARVARDALGVAVAVQEVEDLVGRTAPLLGFFAARPVSIPAFEDGYALARQVRRALHLKGALPSEVAALPPDWESTIEDNFRLPILDRPLATRGVLAFAAKSAEPGMAAIVVNSRNWDETLARRVSVAHELAHALFDPTAGPDGLFIDREEDLLDSRGGPSEQRARAFAAELLVPRAGLHSLLGVPDPTVRGIDNAARLVERAGAHFGSTVELTAHHLANHRYFSEGLHDDVVKAVARWTFPDRERTESLLARRVRQGLDAGVLSEGRARELLGLGAWDAWPGPAG